LRSGYVRPFLIEIIEIIEIPLRKRIKPGGIAELFVIYFLLDDVDVAVVAVAVVLVVLSSCASCCD